MSTGACLRIWLLFALPLLISFTVVAQAPNDSNEYPIDSIEELSADYGSISSLVSEEDSIGYNDSYWEEETQSSEVTRAALNYTKVEYRALGEIDYEAIVERRAYTQEQAEVQQELPSINYNTEVMKTISLVLAGIFIIVLIFGILYFWQKNRVDTDVDIKDVKYSVTDELLSASPAELNDALSENLSSKNYKDAIRFRFGQILSSLRDQGLLEWVPGKTNAEYERELVQPLSNSFHLLAKAFNFAYYSGRNVTEDLFSSFDEQAKVFENDISTYDKNAANG